LFASRFRSPGVMACLLALAAVLAFVAGSASTRAGTHSLTTDHLGQVTNDGVFFDVAATGGVDLVIDRIDVTLGEFVASSGDVEIYTRPGTHVGFDLSADGWTLVANYLDVAPAGNGIATVLGPLTTTVTVPAGQTQAFFILTTPNDALVVISGGGSLVIGTLAASDSFLSIYDGPSAFGPFDPATIGRTPPVTVHYSQSAQQAVGPHWEVRAKVGGGNVFSPFLPDYEPGEWSTKNVTVYLVCVPGDAPIVLLRRDQATTFRDGIHSYGTKPTDVCIDENGLAAEPIVDWGPIWVDTVAPICRITPSTQYVPRSTSGTAAFGLQITDATSGFAELDATLSQSGGADWLSFGFDGDLPPTVLYVTYDIGPSTAGRVTADLEVQDNAGNVSACRATVRAK
jgi:hypothetical protein